MKKKFENAKFGDRFITRQGKVALFLRLKENAEYQFADLYIEDWGIVQVFREDGRECHGDYEHDIVDKLTDSKVVVHGIEYDSIEHWLYNVECRIVNNFFKIAKEHDGMKIGDVPGYTEARQDVDDFRNFIKKFLGYEYQDGYIREIPKFSNS